MLEHVTNCYELMDLCNRMSISCQAADGNNDYTVIDLIWDLPEQTCFCNDRYFSCTLKLDTGYPLSSSVITVGQSDIHI